MASDWLLPDGDAGARLRCYVQPRAFRNGVAGVHDGALKIALTAPPVDGAANAALIAFLAGLFDLPKSAVRIAAGQTGRRKTVALKLSSDAVRGVLAEKQIAEE